MRKAINTHYEQERQQRDNWQELGNNKRKVAPSCR
jgi:hypothetical protein